MVLPGTENIPSPHNKIWPREAKSIHPILSQPSVICTSYEEAALGLATEMSYRFNYKTWESQELPGRLLIAKSLGKSDKKLNKTTWVQTVQTVGLLLIQNPNSRLSCSPPGYTAVLEHLNENLFFLEWKYWLHAVTYYNFCFLSFAILKSCMKAFGEVLTIVKAMSVLVLVYRCVGWRLLLKELTGK